MRRAIASLAGLLAALALVLAGCGDDGSQDPSHGDGSVTDTGVTDTGVTDTGGTDTGLTDTGVADTGVTDSGSGTDTGAAGDTLPEDDTAPPALAAADDFVAVVEGEPLSVDVAANDGGQGPFTIELLGEPSRGAATVAGDATLTYQPPADFNGYVALAYRITDAAGQTGEATAYVGVYATLEADADSQPPMVGFARRAIAADELAVVINTDDPVSVAVGEYYVAQRGLPDANVIRVQVPTDSNVLAAADFEPIRQQIEAATADHIQAYALTWIKPYRVDCMSITTAVAMGGFDQKYCSSPCEVTAAVDYYDSDSTRPLDDHAMRPTMVLGGVDAAYGKALVDRGLAADASFPGGRGHLVRTTDDRRSVRWPDFQSVATGWANNGEFEPVYTDDANAITDDDDVLFYFTGLASVADIDTNTYRPGAVADHLTSYGGKLTATSGQMSIMRWLEAGATGSYGTVVEPCNYQQKFPTVSVFLSHYFRGETLVEAYWKSVRWPGEGIFVGDPLARPWGRHFLRWQDDTLTIETTMLEPNTTYELVGGDAPDAVTETVVADIQAADHRRSSIEVAAPAYRFLRLQRAQ